jgi:hypothetical protein
MGLLYIQPSAEQIIRFYAERYVRTETNRSDYIAATTSALIGL